jgi:hypothetical protein
MELEARGGFKPPIKVLPTFALSLGDRAFVKAARLLCFTSVCKAQDMCLRCQDSMRLNNVEKNDNQVKSVGGAM